MTREEPAQFVSELADSLVREIVGRIDRVPEGWDGHELRCLFAEKAKAAAWGTEIRRHPHGKRARDYRNEVITKCL